MTTTPPTGPNFADALERTLRWEGGYSCDPADPGGETWCGISRVAWPAWGGWAEVDRVKARGYKDLAELDAALRASATLHDLVTGFYFNNFWRPLQADRWPDAGVAADVFDDAVNMGLGTAVKLLQETLGFAPDAQDGEVGPVTLRALSSAPTGLRARFAAERAYRYGRIAQHAPRELGYLVGWLHRALAFAFE